MAFARAWLSVLLVLFFFFLVLKVGKSSCILGLLGDLQVLLTPTPLLRLPLSVIAPPVQLRLRLALALPLPSPRHSLSISTKGTSQRNSVQELPRQFTPQWRHQSQQAQASQRNSVQELPRQFTSTQQAQPPYLLHASTPLHQKPCFHHIHTQIPLFSI